MVQYSREEADAIRKGIEKRDEAQRLADDRARRIKDLVREWVGKHGGVRQVEPTDAERLIGRAAEFIDAIDDAEVPAKRPSASALESVLGNEPDEPSTIGKLCPEYAAAFRSTDDDAEVPEKAGAK